MGAYRDAVERYYAAAGRGDAAAMSEDRHEDFVQEWPQMGERVRGRGNAQIINEKRPGGLPQPTIRRVLEGNGFAVAETDLAYSDGSVWKAVGIFEFDADGKVVRETDYFAAPLPAPEWRAQWVERIE